MSENWHTTKIRTLTYHRLKEYLDGKNSHGYKSITSFVDDAVNEKLTKNKQGTDYLEELVKTLELKAGEIVKEREALTERVKKLEKDIIVIKKNREKR